MGLERKTKIFGMGMPDECRLPFPGVVGKRENDNEFSKRHPESKPRSMPTKGLIKGFQRPRR